MLVLVDYIDAFVVLLVWMGVLSSKITSGTYTLGSRFGNTYST